ncbi:MAG: glutamate racemase [Thermoanaerobacteraceae bacterium]|nr:glutamate racemase [Thermoanaerobacteraceae bacterium]
MTGYCPIGVFDSGVGGLTVAREILKRVPEGKIIYFGDTAHVPYGGRSSKELINFADKICQFLLEQGAEVIVDACNSTSAVALDFLQRKYPVPIIGVIEPGVAAAVSRTKNGRIGVIATEATINSGAHKKAVEKLGLDITVIGQACPLFVPLVEEGKVQSWEALEAAQKYLKPLQQADIDTLILGCTHYPFLVPVLQKVLGPHVVLVDPAVETVCCLQKVVEELPNRNWTGPHKYFVSGDPAAFKRVGSMLLETYSLPEVEKVVLDWGD